MSYFQPPDPPEPDYDTLAAEMFEQYEKCGYAVISREEWNAKLDDAAKDGYAEGRKDEREEWEREVAALLPGHYYMDPPDGGDVTIIEQLRRMAKDAALSDPMHAKAIYRVKAQADRDGLDLVGFAWRLQKEWLNR